MHMLDQGIIIKALKCAHSVDVLALELRDELREAVVISLDANRVENLLDVTRRRGGLATDLEEEVCSNVTHLVGAEE